MKKKRLKQFTLTIEINSKTHAKAHKNSDLKFVLYEYINVSFHT